MEKNQGWQCIWYEVITVKVIRVNKISQRGEGKKGLNKNPLKPFDLPLA